MRIMNFLVTILLALAPSIPSLCSDITSQDAPKGWRIVPLISSKLQKQMTVGPMERGINSLFTANFGSVKGMPLYEKGAPRSIWIIDVAHDGLLTFSRINFIQKGGFYKILSPHNVVDYFDGDPYLQNFIRATTGINDPYGLVYRHGSEMKRGMVSGIHYESLLSGEHNFFVETIISLLQSSARLQYKPNHVVGIRRAALHPCIFVASQVTDAMLFEEFSKISWEAIADYAVKYQYSPQEVSHLRKSYNHFHADLTQLRSYTPAHNDVLCIV